MIPVCQQCGQEMSLQKQGTVSVKRGNCRVRRFYCDLCDITETIYADGFRDVFGEPKLALEYVKRKFDQEEDNQNIGNEN